MRGRKDCKACTCSKRELEQQRCPVDMRCCIPMPRAFSYVYANGKLLGGCDATKALIASGESCLLCTCRAGFPRSAFRTARAWAGSSRDVTT